MSYRQEKQHSLTGYNFKGEIKAVSKTQLMKGIHGFCFSPYIEGQKPGDQLTEAQIRRRIEIFNLTRNGFVLFPVQWGMN